jgi:rod shape-determining protein MreB
MPATFQVGIDLGTSRSTITTSTGQRFTTATCVGYCKDVIARKRFGCDYLLGEEAVANRLALNMVWPLADGVVCEDAAAMKATGLVLQHLLEQVLPGRQPDDQVYAAIGVPAQASLRSKKVIVQIARPLVDKLLIVSEAFAVAYALDRFDECLIVDIGAGTTDLCRMHGAFAEEDDQITLTEAGNYLDQILHDAILQQYPDVQLSAKIVRTIKEKYGYISDTAEPVTVQLTRQGIPGEYDLAEVLQQSCLQLAQPISRAIQTLVGSFDPDFQEALRHNIIIAGGGSRLQGIDKAIEKSLETYGGGRAVCVDDAEFCGSTGTLKLCADMPDDYWEQL